MAKRRTPDRIERDKREALKMALVGKTQHEIADAIGISQNQVSRDLASIRESFIEGNADMYRDAVAGIAAETAVIKQSAWQQFEADPSAQWLRTINESNAMLARLFGVNAAERINIDVTARQEEPETDLDYSRLSRNELRALVALMAKAAGDVIDDNKRELLERIGEI